MTAPALLFSVPDEAVDDRGVRCVVRRSERSFSLYETDGGYWLPVITLSAGDASARSYASAQLPGRLTLRADGGTTLPAVLDRALAMSWQPARNAVVPLAGDTVVSRGARLETHYVFSGPAAPVGYGAAADTVGVEAHWALDYHDQHGGATAAGVVLLQFMPPGVRPEKTDDEEPAPEFLRLRPPSANHFQEFVVIDFGTTACTVTLQSAAQHDRYSVDPDQRTALAGMLAGLLEPPKDAPEQWRAAVAALHDSALRVVGAPGPVTGRAALDLAREGNQNAVDALLLEVEQIRRRSGAGVRAWLIPRLHAGYTRVNDAAPLRLHSLTPVPFPGPDAEPTYAPISALVEDETTEPAATPEERSFQLATAETPGAVTGLKRLVTRPRPSPVPGSDMSAVHLTQHLYLQLIRVAEQLTQDASNPGSTVQTVVITYPTTALPEVKQRLAALVQHGLSAPVVVTEYDEGLAAGLFFVMRELSGNQNLGLEALRARSRRVVRVPATADGTGAAAGSGADGDGRPVPVSPPTWHRTMLVIDIGGGTTDIALLRLVLVDETPERPGSDPALSGRRYRLEPTLLGSTGHEQLGGDLLTLQVFYWLKAVMVDALRPAEDGVPPRRSLAAQVAEQADRYLEKVVSPQVKEVLDRYLPTRWDDTMPAAERELAQDRYRRLWRLAERTKRALGGEAGTDPVVLARTDIVYLVGKDDPLREPAEDLALDRDQFRQLMQPVLRRAAEMGADLVRTTFEREWDRIESDRARGQETALPPVLDQVVLSGRTSSMDLVRQTVESVLSRADAGERHTFGWNPMALAIETGYAAKQATSLGAAWAHGTRDRARVNETVAHRAPSVSRMSDLDIVTHGLFASLPCDLGPLGQTGRPSVLLRAGEPFVELDEIGTRGIRSTWNPLPRLVELHRITSSSRSIQWGSFNLALTAAKARLDLSDPVWQSRRSHGVRYAIEVNHELEPWILLCNGRPHYFVDAGRRHIPLAQAVPGASFEPQVNGCRLPGRLCVITPEGNLSEVFPQPSALPADEHYFPDTFHPDRDPSQHTVAGRIAPIAVPPVDGWYEFHVDDGSGNTTPLERLPVQEAAVHGEQRLHTATLDARGRLSVFRGAVPYAETRSLADVQRWRGLVYRQPMDKGRPDHVDFWDPWTGVH